MRPTPKKEKKRMNERKKKNVKQKEKKRIKERKNKRKTYWVSQKKLSFDIFSNIKTTSIVDFFCNRNYRQGSISEQILNTFGQCQNCQIQTFEQPP